jgi:hypothetical protein
MPTVASNLCFKTQQPFTSTQGVIRDGLGVCVRHYRLSLGTPAIESSSTPLL